MYCAYTIYVTWSERRDSNSRPPAPKAGALPGCATLRIKKLVPAERFELPTFGLQNHCTTAVLSRLAPLPGFEPGTRRLTVACSTAELKWKKKSAAYELANSARSIGTIYTDSYRVVRPEASAPRRAKPAAII